MVPSGAVWANHANEWMLLSPRIETGSKQIQFGGSAVYAYTIPFDRQFSSPPVVVASMATAAGGTAQIDVKAYNITAKDFSLAFITNDGSKPNGVPAVANWIAVGV
ncbi:MAG: H-type lectin domain-containing protein [Staphylococcus lugdunensis]|nr:H-type lectin domain-containing protein [Staphylococcus lugdunensis]